MWFLYTFFIVLLQQLYYCTRSKTTIDIVREARDEENSIRMIVKSRVIDYKALGLSTVAVSRCQADSALRCRDNGEHVSLRALWMKRSSN